MSHTENTEGTETEGPTHIESSPPLCSPCPPCENSDPATQCPVCGEANRCRVAEGCLYKGACWCGDVYVPTQVLRFLAEGSLTSACLCRRCLTALARHSRNSDDPAQILALVREEAAASNDSKDFYHDELGRVVFTAAYHLKRGHCCGNGCKHCPFPTS